ncbi:hypothetical protein V3W47_05030 [Deinococcus sp. YIM 134068]|uniref:hypothetical protein n=1 Tax=Deinococcus lichenicola TaxID=3118910 RepID=UPI002F930746
MQVVTTSGRPDLMAGAGAAFRKGWPEFIFHDEVPPRYMGRVERYFPEYSLLLLEQGRVVAGGWGVPFAWDGSVVDLPTGYDDALIRSVGEHEAGRRPNTLSFMAASVAATDEGRGLATQVLRALIERGLDAGLERVVAPLRPTWKHRSPHIPMAEYARWTRTDGLSIDPWIRTHQRMGAGILGPARRSMVIEGTVAEWEAWTDMLFPVTGSYVVPEALNLVHIDRERDRGTYVEENLWVEHPVGSPPSRPT